MKYKILPKPIKYNGIIYRSRLEARWKAFFDFIGIHSEYEPDYVSAINWMPDFELTIGNEQFLLEIKPYSMWDDKLIDKLFINSFHSKVLLFHESIYPDDLTGNVYLGKIFTPKKLWRMYDFAFNIKLSIPQVINLWNEAKNKTMLYGI